MTRGIVQIGCGVDSVTLYANSDAYPTGLGRNLLDFVSKNPVAELGANDYAMRLLNCDFGLEHDLDWGQNALDWVYRISIGKQGRVSLTAQEVSWGQNDERPQMERLLPPIDLAATIQKEDEEQLANEKHRQELMDSILPCPYCHGKVDPEWSFGGGVYLHCWSPACSRRPTGPRRKTLEEAIKAWNGFARLLGTR